MDIRQSEGKQMRILDAIVSVTLAVAIAIGGWALKSTIDLRERVAVIESSRFTDRDAEQLEQDMRREFVEGIDDIKRCLNAMQQKRSCDL